MMEDFSTEAQILVQDLHELLSQRVSRVPLIESRRLLHPKPHNQALRPYNFKPETPPSVLNP